MTMPTRRYDLLLFDFDGTLADSAVLFDLLLPALAQQRGVPQPAQGWHALRAMDSRAMLRALKIRWWQIPSVTRQMRLAMAQHLHRVQLYPGWSAVLEQLHAQGVQMVVVSSNSPSTVEKVLGPALGLFAAVHCRAPFLGKRAIFKRVVRQAGVAPGRVLSIGDEGRDADASHACGIDFVGVAWGLAHAQVLQPVSDWPLLQQPQDLAGLLVSADQRA